MQMIYRIETRKGKWGTSDKAFCYRGSGSGAFPRTVEDVAARVLAIDFPVHDDKDDVVQ